MEMASVRVDGPIAGQASLISTSFDLASIGYLAEEFFVSGTADSYAATGPITSDGRWDVVVAGQAPFRTRLIVYRPADPTAFNGTAVVEWLNVSAGMDAAAAWLTTHRHLLRAGFAWVGVSAQRIGIDGIDTAEGAGVEARAVADGGIADGGDAGEDGAGEQRGTGWWPIVPSLKSADPTRYAILSHPGDAYSFDIFRQAGETVRRGLLDHLRPARMIAVGASQAAFFLVTYVNTIAARDGDGGDRDRSRAAGGGHGGFDGYLIQGRPGTTASLDGRGGPTLAGDVRLRTDVAVPVMVVQSETDVVGVLGAVGARQPDSDRFRLWEIAGAAHVDTYTLKAGFRDDGALPAAELVRLLVPSAAPFGVPFTAAINSGPQQHYVAQAAIAALDDWIRYGVAPPSAPHLLTAATDPAVLLRDADGIARGGVRTPWVDVPIAVLSGLGQNPTDASAIFGSTRPLDSATLAARYPAGAADYRAAFTRATDDAIATGFLLAEDREEILALAAASYPGR
ncbi:hypothetical protein KBI5_15295 [Frankia sp. KB5]|nr:hypothetical protein CgIS1_20750 [Frankia sp. CgIS1]ORT48663.1 hypothetical protein KBI5_15295 [Frankia sp. KB5]